MFRRGRVAMVLPFLSHQVLEYLAGLYLLQVGAQVGGRAATACYVAGGLMLLAATFSGRPLGGGRLSRPAHRIIDIALIAGIAAAPFVLQFTGDTSAVVRMEGLAVAWIAVVRFTTYHPRPGTARAIVSGLKDNGPRLAGRAVGRRMAAKRRPPGP
jgi:hypothetical protein